MPLPEWDEDMIISVVDTIPHPWPPTEQLVEIGVPVRVAAKYEPIRREMCRKGLKRKAWKNRN